MGDRLPTDILATADAGDSLYHAFFQLMNEGALAVDAAGSVLLCNSCFAMMVREPIDYLCGSPIYEFLALEHRQRVSQTLRLGTAETYESLLLSGSRETMPVLLSLTPVLEADRRTTYIVVTDLRPQHSHVDALRKSEEFRAATLNSIDSGVAVLASDGTIISANTAWHFLGIGHGEPGDEPHDKLSVGRNYIAIWQKAAAAAVPHAQEAVDGIMSVLARERTVFRHDYSWHAADQVRWYTMAVTPLGVDRSEIVVSTSEITWRVQAEESIRNALEEKAVLLRELYHRTKNNMAVIVAMLNMQASTFDDDSMRQAFADAQARITSMALVHEKLYGAQDLTRIDLGDYITDLVESLVESYQVDPNDVEVVLDLDLVSLSIDNAIPCGLILNEMISNALKYAFKARTDPEIKIVLRYDANSRISISVQDNGCGVADGFDFRRDGGLGMQTIFLLGESQLNGEVEFRSRNGLGCFFSFQDTRR